MDATPLPERRTIHRVPGNTLHPVRFAREENGEELLGIVHDITVLGIGIRTALPLDQGAWLELQPANTSGRLASELWAEVRYSRKFEAGYLVGCRFSRLLTLDDMLVLG